MSPINFDSLFSRNRSLFLANRSLFESQITKSLDPPSQFLWDTFRNFLCFICSNCGSFLFPLTYFKGHISLHSPDLLEVLSSFPLRKYFALFHLLLFCDYSGSYLMWINKLSSLLITYKHSLHTALPLHQCRFSLLPTNSWSRSPGADPGHSHVVLTWNMEEKKVESLVAIALTT